jgi:predicted enzyme related to lactoylglutathione lyase
MTKERIVHFEVPVDKPERAANFYKKVFDWKINKWDKGDYWMVETGDPKYMGINGGFMLRKDSTSSGVVQNIVGVDNVDATIKKIQNNGGKIVKPKADVMGVGKLVYFKDTEGNIFGALEPSEEMKKMGEEEMKKKEMMK